MIQATLSSTYDTVVCTHIHTADDIIIGYDGYIDNLDACEMLSSYKKYGLDFIHNYDGCFSLIVIDRQRRRCFIYTDTFGTKPIFYTNSRDSLHINTSDAFISEKLPARSVLIYDMDSSLVVTRRYFNFVDPQVKHDNIDKVYNTLEGIVDNIGKSRDGICLSLSEGYDSGVICAALLRGGIQFKSISINLLHDNEVLNSRNKILKDNHIIIKPTPVSEYRVYRKYCNSIKTLNICDSPMPNLKDTWGFIGGCMILEKASDIMSDTCLLGIGGDLISLNEVNSVIFAPKSLPHPYNEILDVQNACIKSEQIGNTFGVTLIYPFLFKRLWKEVLCLNKTAYTEYKHIFRKYLERCNFPFDINQTVDNKCGLDKSLPIPLIMHR